MSLPSKTSGMIKRRIPITGREEAQMKITKWTKWQAGALGAAGIALLFHYVKESPEFAQAAASPQADGGAQVQARNRGQDPVVQEWQTSRPAPSSPSGKETDGSKGGSALQPGESGGSKQQAPSAAPQVPKSAQQHTRTRHS